MDTCVRWFFMRHFEKEVHPYTNQHSLPLLAQNRELAAQHALMWEHIDREQVSLSSEGRAHARRFVSHVRKLSLLRCVKRVYASPYVRTQQSAEIIADALFPHMHIEGDERLAELHPGLRGSFEFTELCAAFPEYVAQYEREGFLNVPPPYGHAQAHRRDTCIASFLADLKHRHEHALVVTHAGVIDCVHQLVTGARDGEAVARLTNPLRTLCGSLLICRYDPYEDRLTLEAENYLPSRPSS